jgi:hypothetical protein
MLLTEAEAAHRGASEEGKWNLVAPRGHQPQAAAPAAHALEPEERPTVLEQSEGSPSTAEDAVTPR